MHVSHSNHTVYLRWHATLSRHSKRWRSHIHSACEMFASRSRSIRIICSFVTLLLKLANHTKAPWRINTAFCHVILPYTRTARASVRENCLRFRRDVSISLLLAIYFFSNDCEKLLDRTKWITCACILRMHQLSNYRESLTARFKQILIRFNNKFRIVTTKRVIITRRLGERTFHTRWH